MADAAKLFPIAAGPLTNAQAALGVLGNPLNALIIGVGALTAIAGVADAAGNTVGGLIEAVQSGDPEAALNTLVTQAARGAQALVDGAFDPQFGLIAGLQGLREAIAAAITPQAAIAAVAEVPSDAAQSFTLSTPLEKAPALKADTIAVDEKAGSGAVDTSSATAAKESADETSPTEKDVKGGNLFTPGATATKGGRQRADTGPGFAQNLKDAAQKTIKGITGLGRDTSSSATSVKSGESGSSSSPSGDASSGSGASK